MSLSNVVVSSGCMKIIVGDCVCVPGTYFGKHANQLYEKYCVVKVIGRVTEVISGNSIFNVQWDIDKG